MKCRTWLGYLWHFDNLTFWFLINNQEISTENTIWYILLMCYFGFFNQNTCSPVNPGQYNPDIRENPSCFKDVLSCKWPRHFDRYISILPAHKIYISSNECTKSFKNVFGFRLTFKYPLSLCCNYKNIP